MFLKGDSNPKHLNFLVIYFNVSNKISSTPLQLLNFRQCPAPLVYFNHPFISVEEISNTLLVPTPLLLGTQELDLGS